MQDVFHVNACKQHDSAHPGGLADGARMHWYFQLVLNGARARVIVGSRSLNEGSRHNKRWGFAPNWRTATPSRARLTGIT
jgi:hypothetical protein